MLLVDRPTMRIVLLAAVLLASATAAFATDDGRPSQAACDSKKIGARELAECLRASADRADKDLSASVDAAIKSIDTRAGVMSGQKTRWKRSLNDAEAQWLGWRDAECQDVAPFEAGMSAKGGDPRLACIIDRDAQRTADIKARYP